MAVACTICIKINIIISCSCMFPTLLSTPETRDISTLYLSGKSIYWWIAMNAFELHDKNRYLQEGFASSGAHLPLSHTNVLFPSNWYPERHSNVTLQLIAQRLLGSWVKHWSTEASPYPFSISRLTALQVGSDNVSWKKIKDKSLIFRISFYFLYLSRLMSLIRYNINSNSKL